MSKISVKVIPNSKIEQIQQGIDGNLKIWTRAKPVDGEANKKIIEILANYFNCRKSSIRISSGLTSRNKVIEIVDGR